MMLKKLYLLEEELTRTLKLLDAGLLIDVLSGLLISKGIITEAELAGEVQKVKASEKYNFEVHEAEEDIEVYRLMMDMGAKERLRMHGLLNEDGTMKKENAL